MTSSSAPVTTTSSATTSSATTSSAAPSPTSAVAPGHGTPEDAADGLIQAELANNGPELCSYLVPSSQSDCNNQVQLSPFPTVTGNATVDGAVISGSKALVPVTGKLCNSDTGCTSNNDRSLGMPHGKETFAQAYAHALGPSDHFSPVPCIEENGMWYVNAMA
ncbi:MAG TPA: hypothetical protein VIX15_17225 [Streptosporangiaceae bacterium]